MESQTHAQSGSASSYPPTVLGGAGGSQSSPVVPTQQSDASASLDSVARPAATASILTSSGPQLADDSDLIENEWIEAARGIIEGSRGDPFGQCNAIALLRADYIKKRYNKDVKTPEKQ